MYRARARIAGFMDVIVELLLIRLFSLLFVSFTILAAIGAALIKISGCTRMA